MFIFYWGLIFYVLISYHFLYIAIHNRQEGGSGNRFGHLNVRRDKLGQHQFLLCCFVSLALLVLIALLLGLLALATLLVKFLL
jgi:hypothetical protein